MSDKQTQFLPRLSAQLRDIAQRCREREVTIEEVVQTLKGRPYLLLIALLSLPFLFPIPMVALSSPIGFLFVLFGIRLSLGQTPIVPKRLLTMKLPSKFFPSLLVGASGLLRAIETFSRPRLLFLFRKGFLYNIYGVCILVMAILLMPPLPIPYSNFLPALTLLLFSLAMIERDGVLLLLGGVSMLGTLAFFTALIWGSRQVWETLIEKFFMGV
jgi:hypothetical protein